MTTSTATFRLDSNELNEMHRVAHGIYMQGHYDDAARYFWFMWLNAPTDTRYLKGLGASLFMAHSFGAASMAYGCLLQLAPTDAEANCLYGHTLLMLGDRPQATEFLQRSLRLPGGEDIRTRARALLDLIKR